MTMNSPHTPNADATSKSWIAAAWQVLITPTREVGTAQTRRQVRIQNALTLLLAVGLGLGALYVYSLSAQRGLFVTLLIFTLWAAVLFILGRTTQPQLVRYQFPALMSLASFATFLASRDYSGEQALYSFVWIGLAVLATSLIYEVQTTAIVAGLNLAVLALLPLFLSTLSLADVLFPLLFNITVAAAVVLSAQTRKAGESERAQLEQAGEQQQAVQSALKQEAQARARDLALAVEIGNTAARIRDLDELLDRSVELIRSRFGLYHVQIYLTDGASRTLLLQASTGAVGQELLQRGHRLPIGLGSINGTAAMDRRPVIVSDTTNSPIFRPNALLPETRSEMSVPLVTGERVVGVLNLQASQPNELTDDTLQAFEAIAGQLAVAIENANLFAQVSRTQESLAAQAARLARRNWETYWDHADRQKLQFVYAPEGVSAAPETEIEPLNSVIVQPIEVVGAPIGTIEVEPDPSTAWTDEHAELIQAVAAQVAQQVENLRLLNEAERYREEAELAAERLTQEGWQRYFETADLPTTYVFSGEGEEVADGTSLAEAIALSTELAVRGTSIGEMVVWGKNGLDANAAALMTAVGERLSAHIENLRLTQQTERALAEAQRQSSELAAINRVVSSAASSRLLNESMAMVAQEILQVINADQVGVAILNDDGSALTVVAAAGNEETDEASIGVVIPVENNLSTQHVLETRQSLVVYDVANNPMTESIRDILQMRGVKSLVIIPMIAGDKLLGTVGIDLVKPGATISAEQLQLAETLVYQASTVAENIQLLDQLQVALEDSKRQGQRLAQLNEMGTELTTADTLDDIYQLAVARTADIMGSYRAAIYIFNPDTAHTRVYWKQMGAAELVTISETSVAGMIIEQAASRNQFIVVADSENSEWNLSERDLAQLDQLGVRSVMLAPLVTNRGIVGVLAVGSREVAAFSTSDKALMLQIASQLAAILENRRLLREAQRQAQRERLVNDITQKIQGTVTLESALQTAVQELGSALQARLTTVSLATPSSPLADYGVDLGDASANFDVAQTADPEDELEKSVS